MIKNDSSYKTIFTTTTSHQTFLDGIWKRQWLTNMNPLASDLELHLKDFLGSDQILEHVFNNNKFKIKLCL